MGVSTMYDGVARVGAALASGSRLNLLEQMAQGERPVQALADVAGLNLTTASAHLQVLREAGLVRSRREGRQVRYRLSDDDVAALVVSLCAVAERHRPEVAADLASAVPTDDLVLMDRAELLAASRAGRVVVLDVRPTDEYDAGHLPGAVSIPLDELAGRLSELPADAEVVAYCRGRYCLWSHTATRLLNERGRVARLASEGVLEWIAAGIDLERGPS